MHQDHTQLSGCWLRYRPFLDVQQTKAANKENASHKKGQKASYYEYGKVEEFARAPEEYFPGLPDAKACDR